MFEAKCFGIDSAEFRMIAAASLGDVMKQSAEIRDLGFFERLHDSTAVGMLMVEPREREAPKVADDKKCVLIDGVSVEQIVLHATNDTAECRYVKPEHAVAIHASQFVSHALRRAQDGEEKPVVARVLSEFFIDQEQVAFDQADRIGTDTPDVRVLL